MFCFNKTYYTLFRVSADKHISTYIDTVYVIYLPNPMFDLLLESSQRDDSNKRSNIGFGQEIMEFASIETYFKHVIWSSEISFVQKFP